MATYAIGDIQGCYASLKALLKQVSFASGDRLWLTGDLVNRGPKSLDVLRFIMDLGDQAQTVLGNHDLHLLAIYHEATQKSPDKTLKQVFDAPDRHELLGWLQQQPILIDSASLGCVMTHAGIPHIWGLEQAKGYANEIEAALRGRHYLEFFSAMYGNEPANWSDSLSGATRLRTLTNYFTRMRFIAADGSLEFDANAGLESQPAGFAPWFKQPRQQAMERRIITGHWAALGLYEDELVSALDTGCVWGNRLTARRLEDGKIFSVSSCEHE